MKFHGKKVSGAFEELVVIPRPDGNLVFTARAISDYKAFDKLYPEPKGQVRRYPDGREVEDVESPKYRKAMGDWAEARTHWMILESLKATEGLEWESVDMSKPETWKNYGDEMSAAGLSPAEQGRIVQCVSIANGLDQSKIDEATESFLADRVAAARTESSPVSEQPVTPSGEPVKDSA